MALDELHLKLYNNRIMKRVIAGTKYENLKPLFCSHNYLIFMKELKLQELHRQLKLTPQFFLLGINYCCLSINGWVVFYSCVCNAMQYCSDVAETLKK